VGSLPETFLRGLRDGLEHLLVGEYRAIGGTACLHQRLHVLLREMHRCDVHEVVHQLEARPKVQREEAAECVGLRQLLGRPVRSKRAVGTTCDAGDVHQPRWVEVGRRRERPWPALGPARHRERRRAERVGHCLQVGRPAGERPVPLRIRFSLARPVDTDEAQAERRRGGLEDTGFEAAGGAAVVVKDQRAVRVTNLEIGQCPSADVD
jgi:hypothetical protein